MTFHPEEWYVDRLRDAKKLAKDRNGFCLSKKFVNGRDYLKWKCECGHIWFSNYNNIRYGRWCPVCGFERMLESKRYTLDDCIKTANMCGGGCLSRIYKSNKIPLHWVCRFGHEWFACYHNILINNTWCPHCKVISVGEKITRKFFEVGFGKKFFRYRPEWLINEKGNRLELDGYNEELKIAFEYNGEQHAKEFPWFHTHKRFVECVSNDKIKRFLCKKRGVTLIVVDHKISFKDISAFIYDKCVKLGINKKILNLDYRKFDLHVHDLDVERKIVESKGGTLLSDQYIGYDSPFDIICDNGHLFHTSSGNLKAGCWCRYCYLSKKYGYSYDKLGKKIDGGVYDRG